MSRFLPHHDRDWNLAGAVYGQVLVTSLIGAFSEDEGLKSDRILLGVSISILIFWAAHIYAASVARRVRQTQPLTAAQITEEIKNEWPMLQAAIPSLIVLALGALGPLHDDNAIELAIGLGILQLMVWGFVIARASEMGPLRTIGTVLATAAFGLLIVAMKALVH